VDCNLVFWQCLLSYKFVYYYYFITNIINSNMHIKCRHKPVVYLSKIPRDHILWCCTQCYWLNAGKPNSRGSKSCSDDRVSVGCGPLLADVLARALTHLGSGIQTTCIPAASAASTPLGASSNTNTCASTKHSQHFLHLLLLRGVHTVRLAKNDLGCFRFGFAKKCGFQFGLGFTK